MTPAYIVFIKEKTIDAAELDNYRAKVGKSFEGHLLEFCATYGRQEVLEGAPAEGMVLLKFPDWDSAKRWYHGPAYQEAARHRFAGAVYQAILVEGRASEPAPAEDNDDR
uniref:DUF1330 domain-containing protein n=1 Tax=Curvibacter symbiont subsp. Hydra magnipapillata TaxID=667019 RepID=C9YBP9_CURXX|nr:hypothetical protein Csp_A15500 [Curvibacter putative symbiont of Hydra magnipapillata]